ncbi:MAG TPA: DUF2079 domain-containing protein, partial [Polyangiaceae bacterium LLY-WYZ-15_(1-7)]|nr:DUF2079 domain-containing protein [Polyangiaceae bacterium LLY-WYZ-15_(1-7)]
RRAEGAPRERADEPGDDPRDHAAAGRPPASDAPPTERLGPRRERVVRRLVLALSALALGGFAYARFATFHNRTFDLAFYTRMAWGTSQLDLWDPFLETSVLGLHVSPVLVPLGALGHLFGTVPVLVFAQGAAFAGAAAALGRLGERRLGRAGWWLGALALLLHPNVAHVATYEVHPGSLAVWPLAAALERLDAGDRRGLLLACLGVLACREDLALVLLLVAPLAAWRGLGRRFALGLGLGALAWLLLFALVLHPRFAPAEGSFHLHFGPWGDTPGEALRTWLSEPGRVLAHLAQPRKASYLPRVLAPLALLPLLGGRWLLPAAPILAINLLSVFPTTPNLDSHYLTPALPVLVAALLVGLGDALRRWPRLRRPAFALLALALPAGFVLAGPSPFAAAYRPDARTDASEAIVEAIRALDAEAGAPHALQAPDPLLAHLAERPRIHRAPPPDRNADLVVLDVGHRDRYAHQETLLRTSEEPGVRAWQARTGWGVVAQRGPWLLLARGHEDRAPPDPAPREEGAQRLTGCLSITHATETARGLRLHLHAHGPCPADLALRLGEGRRPRRVDLLFGGRVSPAKLRAGERVVSEHPFDAQLPTAPGSLRVGALRSSGARPAHGDPTSVPVPLARAGGRSAP